MVHTFTNGQYYHGPRPVIAAQSLVATVRQANEECENQLDAAGSGVNSMTLMPVALPDGTRAVVTCGYAKDGSIVVRIKTQHKR
jgi:hypothetical protein